MPSRRKPSHVKLTRATPRTATSHDEAPLTEAKESISELGSEATLEHTAVAGDHTSSASADHPLATPAMPLGMQLLMGAARGVVATAAMSATMAGASAVGLLGEPPPHKIVRKTLRRANVRPVKNMTVPLSVVAHFAMGAGLGVTHALLLRSHKRSLAAGLLFGAAVWGLSYGGLIPAAGIMPTPNRDKPGRPTAMLLSHLVFGSTLAATSVIGR